MFNKLLALFVAILSIGLLSTCVAVRRPDHNYGSGSEILITTVTQEQKNAVLWYAGCSAVVLATKNGKSYIATAGHCYTYFFTRKELRYLKTTPESPIKYPIIRDWVDYERDIAFFEVEGTLSPFPLILRDKPNEFNSDIIVGFVDNKMVVLVGRAIPGTSGGAVIDAQSGGLWGCVSTTGEGTSVYPALERLGLLWMLNK